MKLFVSLLFIHSVFAQLPGTVQTSSQPGGRPGVQAAADEPTPPEDLCALAGAVTAAGSKEPLKKARLMLMSANPGPGMQPYVTTTDATGRYAMKGIEPGRYRLSVFRAGYGRMEYGAKRPIRRGTTLTLNKGQQIANLDFALIRHSVIAGRVVDEDDEPVLRAFVEALQYSWIEGRRQLRPLGMHTTDDRGQFRIAELPPGKYFVRATLQNEWGGGFARDLSAVEAPDESYTPTYFPGTTDSASAAVVETGLGTEMMGIDLRLLKTPTVRIKGKIVPASPAAGRRANVMLISRSASFGPMDRRYVQQDLRGNFEIRGVAPGSYILMADSYDGTDRRSARLPLDVGKSSIDSVVLTLAAGGELRGSARLEDGSALDVQNVRIMLRSRENPFYGMAGGGTLKDDRSFVLQNVVADVYNVVLYGLPRGHYLKSAQYGQEDALARGLDLTQGAAGSLEIVISPNGATVEGVVMNDRKQPASGVAVVIAPQTAQPGRQDLYRVISSDQTGRYSFEGVPPGKYHLFAFEDLEEGASQDPAFLKEFESKSEKVDVSEKSVLSKELAAIPADDRPAAK